MGTPFSSFMLSLNVEPPRISELRACSGSPGFSQLSPQRNLVIRLCLEGSLFGLVLKEETQHKPPILGSSFCSVAQVALAHRGDSHRQLPDPQGKRAAVEAESYCSIAILRQGLYYVHTELNIVFWLCWRCFQFSSWFKQLCIVYQDPTPLLIGVGPASADREAPDAKLGRINHGHVGDCWPGADWPQPRGSTSSLLELLKRYGLLRTET